MQKEAFDKKKSLESGQSFFKEFFSFILFAVIIVVPIRIFIAQPFIVSGASMDPTFHSGDYLIVDQLSYRFHEPKRGDVVIFKFPEDKSKYFIKRIVGLPNEEIIIRNGEVSIGGKTSENSQTGTFVLNEDYVVNKSYGNYNLDLGKSEYFVMGDNRPESLDSRNWGALPEDLIRGRALVRLLPVNKLGVFPGSVIKSE